MWDSPFARKMTVESSKGVSSLTTSQNDVLFAHRQVKKIRLL